MTETRLNDVFEELMQHQFDAALPYGQINLASNPQLLDTLIDRYKTVQPNIPTYKEFVACFDDHVNPPPSPDKDDPAFDPTREQWAKFTDPKWQGRETQIAEIIRLQNFQGAEAKHREKRHTFQIQQKRIDRLKLKYRSDYTSYLAFLTDHQFAKDKSIFPTSLAKSDRAFLQAKPDFTLKEFDRQRHTYITAETGHGKSVAIETLIHHYLVKDFEAVDEDRPCLILIDPHGDLAKTVTAFRGREDRDDWLVYIKPALSPTLTPSINPFELADKNWNDIALATDAFIEVFREVMGGDKDGASFSPQMVTILKPCIATLLHMDHTTVADLIPFLSDEPAEYNTYLNHARRHLSNPSQLEFLKKDFFRDSYNPSKLSIKTKIRNLLADDYFLNFLCGQTTVNLEQEIKKRSVILFDLSDLTEAASIAIGRFIMATITRFAFAQGEKSYNKRIPIHLFIDECQDFISDSMKQIVTKTRKFRLHGTFAQQFTGQGMKTDLRRAIIGNSRIKISGKNELNSLRLIAAETGASLDELQSLDTGEFHIKAGKAPSVAVQVPMIGKKLRISDKELELRM